MPLSCCAHGCTSKFIKGSGITFHSFPKDPKRRKLWEIQVKRKDFKATVHSKLCSKHFTEDCFNRLKFGGTWLKDDAVPTIFNFPKYMQRIQEEFPVEKKLSSKESPIPERSITMLKDNTVPTVLNFPEIMIKVQNEFPVKNELSKIESSSPERYITFQSDFHNQESIAKRRNRLYFFGDFKMDDMESPEKAKEFFLVAQYENSRLKQKIRTLRQKERRLTSLKKTEKRLTSLKKAQKENLLTNTAILEDMNEVGKSNILEFLMLVGKLKHLKRTGWVKRNIPECETVAGHMYRMSIMAFLLDDDAFLGIDKDRCIKMALIHDIAECIVGDITPFCGVSKEEKHRREVNAMERLCNLVGKKHGEEIFKLFMEYEEQETPEAKAVKDLDKFDMILQAFEYEAEMKQPNFLQGFFDNTEGTFTNPLISKWVKELKAHREQSQPQIVVKEES